MGSLECGSVVFSHRQNQNTTQHESAHFCCLSSTKSSILKINPCRNRFTWQQKHPECYNNCASQKSPPLHSRSCHLALLKVTKTPITNTHSACIRNRSKPEFEVRTRWSTNNTRSVISDIWPSTTS